MLPGALTKSEYAAKQDDLKDRSVVCYWCDSVPGFCMIAPKPLLRLRAPALDLLSQHWCCLSFSLHVWPELVTGGFLCSTVGYRSSVEAKDLTSKGVDAYNLRGSLMAWVCAAVFVC